MLDIRCDVIVSNPFEVKLTQILRLKATVAVLNERLFEKEIKKRGKRNEARKRY